VPIHDAFSPWQGPDGIILLWQCSRPLPAETKAASHPRFGIYAYGACTIFLGLPRVAQVWILRPGNSPRKTLAKHCKKGIIVYPQRGTVKPKFIPVEELFKQWKKDPKYVAAYHALDAEFALASAMIKARTGADMT